MANEVRLPQLGQTMEEGTIVSCLVKVGDEVKKGDVIFEIETDKATLEMESPAAGFVKHILVAVDETLPVGAPLLVLGDKDEDVPQSFIDALKGGAPAAPEAAPAAEAAPAPEPAKAEPAKPAGRVMASPRAKKLAADMGVDLTTVTGTGPGGKITEEDVKSAGAAKPSKPSAPAAPSAEPKAGQTIKLNRLQKITADRMLRSKREIPCFYLTVKADVSDLVELRTKMNQAGDVKLSYNDFIVKAVATGLEKFPIMTGQLDGEAIKLAETINVGLAISVPDGLVAPILKDVNKKNVQQIARDSLALIDRARSNRLAPTDLEGGCITVSNLGAFGIDNFLVRKLMNMTLSVDHKVANGAYAAQFLDFTRKLLEDTSTFDLKS